MFIKLFVNKNYKYNDNELSFDNLIQNFFNIIQKFNYFFRKF